MNDENETPPADAVTIVYIVCLASLAVFSAYQIGKLGTDLTREAIRSLKTKKAES